MSICEYCLQIILMLKLNGVAFNQDPKFKVLDWTNFY